MLGHNQRLPEYIENATEFFRTFREKFEPIQKLATTLEANQKVILSQLTLAANAKSFNEREAIARTQPEYMDAVNAFAAADAKATGLKLDKACQEMLVSIWQTKSSNERTR